MEARKFNKLLKTIRNNEKSFRALYDYYGGRIVDHLSGTYGRTLAEDVAQEFLIKLYNEDKDYGYIEKPTSWVYLCCENLAKTKLRTECKYMLVDDDPGTADDVDGYDKFAVKFALDTFDEDTQNILRLYYWEGYTLVEISAMLHIDYCTVRKRHSRAIQELKNLLE